MSDLSKPVLNGIPPFVELNSEGLRTALAFMAVFRLGKALTDKNGPPKIAPAAESSLDGKIVQGPDGRNMVRYGDPEAHRRFVTSLANRLRKLGRTP